jgi:hypothetical protein
MMTGRNILNIAVRWVALFLFLVALRTVNGGQAWAFMMNHPWQTIFVIPTLLFLLSLAHGLYKWHKLKPEGVSKKVE